MGNWIEKQEVEGEVRGKWTELKNEEDIGCTGKATQ
jgi:hypothetical protein